MRRPTESYNLQVINPNLSEQWHPTKNGNLTPKDVAPRSRKKVWWRCKKGHSWKALVSNRTGLSSGCPECARKANRKYSIDDFQAIADKHGGKCISKEFFFGI